MSEQDIEYKAESPNKRHFSWRMLPAGELYSQLGKANPKLPEYALEKGRQLFGKSHHATEAVRKGRAEQVLGKINYPFVGVEGLWVGIKLPPDEILQQVAQMGRLVFLDAPVKQFAPGTARRKYFDTLNGKSYDLEMLRYLDASWGSFLGRLRGLKSMHATPVSNAEYDSFRDKTYALINPLKRDIELIQDASGSMVLLQEYDLPVPDSSNGSHAVVLGSSLNEGYNAAIDAGRITAPYLRVLTQLPQIEDIITHKKRTWYSFDKE